MGITKVIVPQVPAVTFDICLNAMYDLDLRLRQTLLRDRVVFSVDSLWSEIHTGLAITPEIFRKYAHIYRTEQQQPLSDSKIEEIATDMQRGSWFETNIAHIIKKQKEDIRNALGARTQNHSVSYLAESAQKLEPVYALTEQGRHLLKISSSMRTHDNLVVFKLKPLSSPTY